MKSLKEGFTTNSDYTEKATAGRIKFSELGTFDLELQ
jgi:hypothetical protein